MKTRCQAFVFLPNFPEISNLCRYVAAGVMKESDVHAEIGQIISGAVRGRTGKELIVMDLTGTGAQDAAIGSYVMDVLD
jgi:ornithine cyclodeaminase/alanine dehydrogenase-like protein (mu-crystallin family)